MKKLKSKSIPIVGGTQMGQPWLNPKNHASKGIVNDMPIATNIPSLGKKKFSAKHAAIKAANGEKG